MSVPGQQRGVADFYWTCWVPRRVLTPVCSTHWTKLKLCLVNLLSFLSVSVGNAQWVRFTTLDFGPWASSTSQHIVGYIPEQLGAKLCRHANHLLNSTTLQGVPHSQFTELYIHVTVRDSKACLTEYMTEQLPCTPCFNTSHLLQFQHRHPSSLPCHLFVTRCISSPSLCDSSTLRPSLHDRTRFFGKLEFFFTSD